MPLLASRAGPWIGAGVLFVALVVVLAWVRLSRPVRYEGDPAAIAENERHAVRRVGDLARRGERTEEQVASGYVVRSDGARAYAWPERYGVSGIRTYVADRAARVAWTNAAPYSGAGHGPSPGAELAPGASELSRRQTGADGNEWRLLHD
jgi:hypothetical protein